MSLNSLAAIVACSVVVFVVVASSLLQENKPADKMVAPKRANTDNLIFFISFVKFVYAVFFVFINCGIINLFNFRQMPLLFCLFRCKWFTSLSLHLPVILCVHFVLSVYGL